MAAIFGEFGADRNVGMPLIIDAGLQPLHRLCGLARVRWHRAYRTSAAQQGVHKGDDFGYSYCAAIARSNKFRMAAWPSASFTWVRLVAPITGLMATIATSFARSRSPVN